MYIFNCAQRAHQNFNENYPSVLLTIMVAGIKYPIATTALGMFWAVNRIAYAVGYTKAEEKGERKAGKGRYYGAGWYLSYLGLAVLSLKTGYDVIMS
jgi:glutathione S-transferase